MEKKPDLSAISPFLLPLFHQHVCGSFIDKANSWYVESRTNKVQLHYHATQANESDNVKMSEP
jgi:hypothetical protein